MLRMRLAAGPGLKPFFLSGINVRAKARTYLKGKNMQGSGGLNPAV
jgi:hypothetical protein